MKDAILLDLFSGLGGFHLGLMQAGFTFKKTYFSEIDKHAIANYKRNFPDAEYVGSVTDIRGSTIERPNIITFGSPCQDFSLAGKRKGMDGDRSSLISEAIRLIAETRPDVFIWENVKGTFSSNEGEDFWTIIEAFTDIGGYRLEWQLLNTSWFLPQNRERVYLVGTLATARRGSGDIFPLRKEPSRINERTKQTTNARCFTAGGNSGGLHSSMTLIKQDATNLQGNDIANCIRSGGRGSMTNKHNWDCVRIKQSGRGYNKGGMHDICPTITSNSFEHNNHVQVGSIVGFGGKQHFRETSQCPTLMARAREDGSGRPCIKIGAIRGRNPDNPKSRVAGDKTQQMLEINEKGTSNCLTTVQKYNVVVDNSNIRRLTEIECTRLQGFPDNHTEYGIYDGEEKKISATQRYKLLGNSVSVPVVKAVAERIINVMPDRAG